MVAANSCLMGTNITFYLAVCLRVVGRCKRTLDMHYTTDVLKTLCNKTVSVLRDELFWKSVVKIHLYTIALATSNAGMDFRSTYLVSYVSKLLMICRYWLLWTVLFISPSTTMVTNSRATNSGKSRSCCRCRRKWRRFLRSSGCKSWRVQIFINRSVQLTFSGRPS